MQKLELGDQVFYNHEGRLLVGIVAKIHNAEVLNLCVIDDSGTTFSRQTVYLGEGNGRWNYKPTPISR